MGFKNGDLVTWTSQAAGSWKTKTGTIIRVYPQIGKRAESYAVSVSAPEGSKAKPKIYHPRTSALKKVEPAA